MQKTTSECWQRTLNTQKGSPLSSKGGRKKYKRQKKETKEVRTELRPGRESYKERSFQKPGNILTAESAASLGTTDGNIIRRKNK